jgi:hypothetical protein
MREKDHPSKQALFSLGGPFLLQVESLRGGALPSRAPGDVGIGGAGRGRGQ